MLSILALAGLAATALAAPASQSGCTFTDANAAIKGKASCSNIVLQNISVPAGVTLDLTDLNSGTNVTFQGKTSFGYKEWLGPLIAVSGSNINVVGAPGNLIDCGGQRWWDGKGGNGGKIKPKFFAAHDLQDSNIRNLNVLNTPVQAFSINTCTNLGIYNIIIDDSAGDNGPNGAHNTDGFDVGSSNGVHISGCIVKNQDDCLAINSGTNITFTNGTCIGGHGLSVGSVGDRKNNVVETIRIINSVITESVNGIRIKTIAGAIGSVTDVLYSGITMSGISCFGIIVQQDYKNGVPTGKPTSGVPITNLNITGITGNVKPSGTNIQILCGSKGCRNWNLNAINLSGGQQSAKPINAPPGALQSMNS
ncbi:endopolygalacturonase 1 precursor [Colletotrichum orchidophilum]|uniref:endo-polygalacturonase n=1 Tax=Colletotrichum orchidophilum TaxID=1209926 RepID=A0A1G4BH49_9PEZI|nr:endopolygalacturonase 1 precursor [Colletotrichum orchidophilum]OHF00656.1 endopolygalacturonase 1 precursor [Colletotrichum orchidophilum]